MVKYMKDLKIKVKLILAFLLVSIITLIVGVYGVKNLEDSNENLKDMYKDQLLPQQYLGEIEVLYEEIRVYVRNMTFTAKTAEEKTAVEQEVEANFQQIQERSEMFQKSMKTESEKQLFEEYQTALADFIVLTDKNLSYGKNDDAEGLLANLKSNKGKGDLFEQKIQELSVMTVQKAKNANDHDQEAFHTAEKTTYVIIGVAVVFSILLGWALSMLISRPLKRVVELTESVSRGDLTHKTDIDRGDEVGLLAKSMNEMVDNLRQMMQGVLSTSNQVAASSEELSASAEQTSRATEEISSSIQIMAVGAEAAAAGLEESSASMDEVTSTIQQIAESSKTIAEASSNMEEQARAGEDFVDQTAMQIKTISTSVDLSEEAMLALAKRSQEIGEITEVITEIANQTNLLALNAAIEAARAGEHGRGFAIVADEVRKLAEQSQASSTQISELIKEIQGEMNRSNHSIHQVKDDVREGLTIVAKTEESFRGILNSVEESKVQIDEMGGAAEQLTANAQEVSSNVTGAANNAIEAKSYTQNVAAATEQQLASMEEISASSNNLSKMATDLQDLISRFKI